MKAIILKTEKKNIVATGDPFLEVTVQLLEGKKVLDTKVFGYPIDTKPEFIKTELKKYAELHITEKAQRVSQEVADAQDTQTQKTINTLEGEEIEIDEAKTLKKVETKSTKKK